MEEKEVRKERTDWRDTGLDKLHAMHGYHCPCDNVEFLMVEYDMSKPVALVDYRLKGRLTSGPSQAVINFCNEGKFPLPYIITSYEIKDESLQNFDIQCCNEQAKKEIGNKQNISEKDYIQLMYALREKIIPGRTQQGIKLSNTLGIQLTDDTENWPGEVLSHRHRDWGWDCPVVDMDFLVINNGKVVAIVEYKNHESRMTPKKFRFHPTGKTFINLASRIMPNIPVLFVYYNDNFTEFRVFPINGYWNEYEENFGHTISKEQYFKFLKNL